MEKRTAEQLSDPVRKGKGKRIRIDKVRNKMRLTSDQLYRAIMAKLAGSPPFYIYLDKRNPLKI
jgi:hypothetical protein